MICSFQDFLMDLSAASEVESFDEKDYYGIIFKMSNLKFQFQVIHNRLMGYRIYIYNNNGHLQDIPFHKGTVGFLPDGIKVQWKA
jgi:hypothetical protein